MSDPKMSNPTVLELGHDFAEDILVLQNQKNLDPKELFMGLLVAQRILQDVFFPDQNQLIFDVFQEADATYMAISHNLTGN